VTACVFQGGGGIARGFQCPHEADCGPGAEWIQGCQAAPPRYRGGPVTTLVGLLGQNAQRLGIQPREAVPLRLGPALKLVQPRKIEAVEKGPLVQGHCGGGLPRGEGGLESPDVYIQQSGIEPEGSLGADDYVPA
jgi:hypothetical protein